MSHPSEAWSSFVVLNQGGAPHRIWRSWETYTLLVLALSWHFYNYKIHTDNRGKLVVFYCHYLIHSLGKLGPEATFVRDPVMSCSFCCVLLHVGSTKTNHVLLLIPITRQHLFPALQREETTQQVAHCDKQRYSRSWWHMSGWGSMWGGVQGWSAVAEWETGSSVLIHAADLCPSHKFASSGSSTTAVPHPGPLPELLESVPSLSVSALVSLVNPPGHKGNPVLTWRISWNVWWGNQCSYHPNRFTPLCVVWKPTLFLHLLCPPVSVSLDLYFLPWLSSVHPPEGSSNPPFSVFLNLNNYSHMVLVFPGSWIIILQPFRSLKPAAVWRRTSPAAPTEPPDSSRRPKVQPTSWIHPNVCFKYYLNVWAALGPWITPSFSSPAAAAVNCLTLVTSSGEQERRHPAGSCNDAPDNDCTKWLRQKGFLL